MEQNEEERGGSCGLRITGTRQSFGFYSKYGRESFQDFEQKSEGVKKKKKSEGVRFMFQWDPSCCPMRKTL